METVNLAADASAAHARTSALRIDAMAVVFASDVANRLLPGQRLTFTTRTCLIARGSIRPHPIYTVSYEMLLSFTLETSLVLLLTTLH